VIADWIADTRCKIRYYKVPCMEATSRLVWWFIRLLQATLSQSVC